jgi:TolA-binding protein
MASRFVLALCLAVAPGLFVATASAFGDGGTSPNAARGGPASSGPGASGEPSARPPFKRPPRSFLDACAHGAAQYAARDYAAAVETFRQASDAFPQSALGPYLLGEALLASGDLAGAEEAWRRASASSEDQPVLHARVLFVLADAKEREKRWDEAKLAWEAYRAWGERNPSSNAFAGSARSRMDVIDRVVAQQRVADAVRRRIAETQDGGVFNDPTKGDAQK